VNQTLSPASERLKTVNLTKSSTKSTALDSVGASTEEVCWLPVYTVNTGGEQVLKLYKHVVEPTQQENKG
jgi:hypothetical protein